MINAKIAEISAILSTIGIQLEIAIQSTIIPPPFVHIRKMRDFGIIGIQNQNV